MINMTSDDKYNSSFQMCTLVFRLRLLSPDHLPYGCNRGGRLTQQRLQQKVYRVLQAVLANSFNNAVGVMEVEPPLCILDYDFQNVALRLDGIRMIGR